MDNAKAHRGADTHASHTSATRSVDLHVKQADRLIQHPVLRFSLSFQNLVVHLCIVHIHIHITYFSLVF